MSPRVEVAEVARAKPAICRECLGIQAVIDIAEKELVPPRLDFTYLPRLQDMVVVVKVDDPDPGPRMHASVGDRGLGGIVVHAARNRGVFAASIGPHRADAPFLRAPDELRRDIGASAAKDLQALDAVGERGIEQPLQKRCRADGPGALLRFDQRGGRWTSQMSWRQTFAPRNGPTTVEHRRT